MNLSENVFSVSTWSCLSVSFPCLHLDYTLAVYSIPITFAWTWNQLHFYIFTLTTTISNYHYKTQTAIQFVQRSTTQQFNIQRQQSAGHLKRPANIHQFSMQRRLSTNQFLVVRQEMRRSTKCPSLRSRNWDVENPRLTLSMAEIYPLVN